MSLPLLVSQTPCPRVPDVDIPRLYGWSNTYDAAPSIFFTRADAAYRCVGHTGCAAAGMLDAKSGSARAHASEKTRINERASVCNTTVMPRAGR
jgi:hypothetical protein